MEGTQLVGQLKRRSEYEGVMKYEVVHECHFFRSFVALLASPRFVCWVKVDGVQDRRGGHADS